MRRTFYEKVKKYGSVDTRKYRYVLEDNSMKISKDEAVYAVLKMVLNEQVSLRMVYDDLWLYYLLVGLDLSKQEVIDAEYEIKEAILNCLKENLKI